MIGMNGNAVGMVAIGGLKNDPPASIYKRGNYLETVIPITIGDIKVTRGGLAQIQSVRESELDIKLESGQEITVSTQEVDKYFKPSAKVVERREMADVMRSALQTQRRLDEEIGPLVRITNIDPTIEIRPRATIPGGLESLIGKEGQLVTEYVMDTQHTRKTWIVQTIYGQFVLSEDEFEFVNPADKITTVFHNDTTRS
jgi:preprotein translocase subunit YajC